MAHNELRGGSAVVGVGLAGCGEAPGRTAMELLSGSGEPFDAVLLDLRMPDMDGVEFLRALRRQPVHRGTPVVLTTAEPDDSELMAQARRLGVAAVVKKPWSPQALRSVVEKVTESAQG